MIPLRDATYRAYPFTFSLEGTAIAGGTPYEIHFDTGSWTTSIPGGALDFSKLTVIYRLTKGADTFVSLITLVR
ncbi:MAG: hypothetical protein IAE99_08820 [Rhodothermales bacterium]|nr:hypothetical protein [Rhodothermales bacterium]